MTCARASASTLRTWIARSRTLGKRSEEEEEEGGGDDGDDDDDAPPSPLLLLLLSSTGEGGVNGVETRCLLQGRGQSIECGSGGNSGTGGLIGGGRMTRLLLCF